MNTDKPQTETNTMLGAVANHQLGLAIAQLTGWHHAKMNGDRIIDLIESMGLTKTEWIKIKHQVTWLNTSDFLEIDRYFRKQ